MSLKIHIDSRLGKCCGAVVQPSGATSRQTCAAPRQATSSHELTGKQQQVLSKCDTCQRAMQPPCYQDCDLFSDGTMITFEHQPPPASISSASSCLKQSLCQVHTQLQPEEGGGYSSPFSEPANVQLMQRHRRRHASCMHAGTC